MQKQFSIEAFSFSSLRIRFRKKSEESILFRLFLRFILGLFIGFLGVFLFSSCSTPTALTDSGYRVKMINGLSPSESAYYQELSVVDCFVPEQSLPYDEGCKNELRNQAAIRGGQYLVVESREHTFCLDSISSVSRPCGIKMVGRVYRKK